jgi:hypothetical protein
MEKIEKWKKIVTPRVQTVNLMNDDFPPLPPHHRLILVFCMRLFYFVRCWPPAYGNSSSGQKNTSQMGFEPMITGTYRPHPNHYTTCPVLVLTCLIFFLYVNWCHLISRKKKRQRRGDLNSGYETPHWSPLPPHHLRTSWFWISCFFFIASMTARLVTRTPRPQEIWKKIAAKGGFEPWSQGRDSDALPLRCY